MSIKVYGIANCDTVKKTRKLLESKKVAAIAKLAELVKANGDRLIILGDLFDFWFEYRHAIPKEHADVLVLLKGIVGAGIEVDYVSGNHDFWMDDYFEKQIGVTLHRDAFDLTYNGLKLHLLHGDGLAKADRGYRLLKRILRNRFNICSIESSLPTGVFRSGSESQGRTSE